MEAQPVYPDSDSGLLRELRQQVRGAPPLKAEEVNKLVAKAALGDSASQERLVAANLAMVLRLAEARADRGLPVGDLVQEGSLGLVEAVRTFGDEAGDDFGAFAERKAGEQMDAALAAEAAAVRDAELLVAAASDYERTEILLHKLLRRPATEAEIAEKLEWTVDRTRYVAAVVADARRRHDEELLAFIDPDAAEFGDTVDGE
ncbi:MAG TPA: sigma factor [Candidatus Dormibacteraeota bacterium]|jgi:DNA-directed RNA polymerase sigma subunit (sigma70/sigma32)